MVMLKLPENYDGCILGVVQRCGQEPFLVYDTDSVIEVLMADEDMSADDARDWFETNMAQAWVGDGGPGYLIEYRPEDYVDGE